jgi:hypothetical protein
MQNSNKRFWFRSVGEGHAQATDGQQGSASQRSPQDSSPAGETMLMGDNDRPMIAMENDDPMRRRAKNGGKKGFMVLVWEELLLQIRYLTRKLSPEESAEMAEKRRRRELTKTLTDEARTWEGWLIGALDRLGMKHKIIRDGKVIRTQHVSFNYIAMEPDSIAYHVNTARLPDEVSVDRLKEEEVINNLAMSAGRRITCRWTVESGIWYIIERASGRAGIRNHVQISEMWDAMPASANALTIPVGITHNARMIYTSIADMPHALIAGTTGSGKSNFEHVGINTLIRRNTPDRVRLVLIDLKGGLEFQRYVGVPHLLHITCDDPDKTGIPCDSDIAPDGIVTERDRVPDLLAWLRAYGEKRMKQLRAAECSNIGEYNAHKQKGRLPFIVIWVDEWADVRLGKGGQDAENELVNLVQRMRAVGMYFILATQIPKSEVITGLIKGNLPCRFAFSVPNIHASQTIIDTGDAAGLEPTGRCIMQHRGEIQIQTPYISKELIKQTIAGARTGVYTQVSSHDVTPNEVMNWALTENNGWLSWRTLWAQFQQRGIPQEELESWIKSWEGKEFLIDTSTYRVNPGQGNRGRRLVAVDVAAPEPEPVKEKINYAQEYLSASLGYAVVVVDFMDTPGGQCCWVEDVATRQIKTLVPESDLYPGATDPNAH